MAVECSSESCPTTVQTGSGSIPECSGQSCPMCQTACGGDPIACASAVWTVSFFQAMKAAQVDLLKVKIQKTWGAKMEKAADVILEAMGVKWQSMLAEAKAKADVREQLARLWQQGQT